jgi:hypothetical protein
MGTVSGAGTYLTGSSVTAFANAKPGYVLLNWTESGASVSTQTNYTFTIVSNRNLRANFALAFTVSASATPVGGGTVSGAGAYPAGAVAQLSATPSAGYAFVNWTENGVSPTNSPNYQFVVSSNRTLLAHFQPLVVAPPQLSLSLLQPDTLVILWPTNAGPFVLQQNSVLTTTNWLASTNAVSVAGSNSQVVISPLIGNAFFRLVQP